MEEVSSLGIRSTSRSSSFRWSWRQSRRTSPTPKFPGLTAGISIETRDAKGGLSLKRADNLGRTTHVWGRDQTGESVRLCERVIFGDAAGGPSSPKADNHLGKPYRHYDEAGRVNFEAYDFKGNQLTQTRRVIDPQHMIDAYQAADSSNNWEVDTYRVDWTTSSGQTLGDRASQLLKPRDYTVTKAYDGLDRARQIHYPADKNGHRALAEPAYNKAGNLQSVSLDGNAYVERIAYNPRGQRILAALGNGAMVRYEYDDVTFRLERLRSEGYTKPDGTTYSPAGNLPHQDFTYTYDAAGNITELESYGNNVGTGTDNDTLTRHFVYDALYRLTDATGREFNALDGNGDPTISKSKPWQDNGGNSGNGDNTRPYAEHYSYDDVGNMTKLVHEYGEQTTQWDGSFNFQQPGSWSRYFSHETSSNQLAPRPAHHSLCL